MRWLYRLIYPVAKIDDHELARRYGGKHVVITGASSGIGEALAYRLMDAGAHLYLLARNADRLRHICEDAHARGVEAHYISVDFRNKEETAQTCRQIADEWQTVDCLFCNAGKSICRSISDAQDRLHDYDRTMDINYRSMVALSLALLPAMKRCGGTLVYTSSVSALYPPAPRWSAYHASKCAANVWCDTARVEWSREGVKVKVAYMPLVRTPMSDANVRYRTMPAYSAVEAADILARLCVSRRYVYKPWWASLSVPLSWMFAPLVRMVFCKSYK